MILIFKIITVWQAMETPGRKRERCAVTDLHAAVLLLTISEQNAANANFPAIASFLQEH